MPIQVKSLTGRRRGRPSNYVRRRLELALEAATDELVKDMRQATRTWKRKPVFTFRRRAGRAGNKRAWIWNVFTDDPRWEWISEGTGIHGPKKRTYKIRPKKPGGRLRFGTPYTPATKAAGGAGRPRFIAQQASVGGDIVYAKEVTHPGIAPRRLNRTITRRHQKRVRILVESALDVSFLDKGRSRRVR